MIRDDAVLCPDRSPTSETATPGGSMPRHAFTLWSRGTTWWRGAVPVA